MEKMEFTVQDLILADEENEDAQRELESVRETILREPREAPFDSASTAVRHVHQDPRYIGAKEAMQDALARVGALEEALGLRFETPNCDKLNAARSLEDGLEAIEDFLNWLPQNTKGVRLCRPGFGRFAEHAGALRDMLDALSSDRKRRQEAMDMDRPLPPEAMEMLPLITESERHELIWEFLGIDGRELEAERCRLLDAQRVLNVRSAAKGERSKKRFAAEKKARIEVAEQKLEAGHGKA